MKQILFIFIMLFLSVSLLYGQGKTDSPFDISGWDKPVDSSDYYSLYYYQLLSNPGGWINRNTRKIDSLFNELVVYTDSTQLVIEDDTLSFASDFVQQVLDSTYAVMATGAMAFKDSSYVLTLTQDAEAQVTNDNNDLFSLDSTTSHGITLSGDTLYFNNGGIYNFAVHLSFAGDTGGLYDLFLKESGNEILLYQATISTDSNTCKNISFNATVELADAKVQKGVYLTLWIENSRNDADATLRNGGIIFEQVK